MAHTQQHPDDLSARTAARWAGALYLALGVVGMVANFAFLERLTVTGDAVETTQRLAASEGLARAGVLAFALIVVLDVVIAWALHLLLRRDERDLSLLAAWFRVLYAAILGVVVADLLVAVDAATAIGGADAARVMGSVDTFTAGWLVGLVFFGVHLVLVGALLLRARRAPRVLGVLLVLAGLGYAVGNSVDILLPDGGPWTGVLTVAVAVPSIVGEFGFAFWLLLRGGVERGTATPAADRVEVAA